MENEFKGLVRAVYVVGIGRCGCVDGTSREGAEEHGNIWAVGKWHRHDEADLKTKLEREHNILRSAYSKICGTEYSGGIYTYEYKPYKE